VTDAPFKLLTADRPANQMTSNAYLTGQWLRDENGVAVIFTQYPNVCAYLIESVALVNAHEALRAENERLKAHYEAATLNWQAGLDERDQLREQVGLTHIDWLNEQRENVELRERVRELEEALQQHRASVKEAVESANEERLKHQDECEREAEKWKSEGDMYGWNFHMGRAAGMNYMDILWDRVKCAALRASEPKE
jgi:hypothetical protein